MNRRSLLLLPLLALSLMGAGCLTTTSTTAIGDGGVFRTRDAAATWQQLKVLNLDTQIGSTAEMGTVTAAFDPEDPNAMYVGTVQDGLMYSLNNGQSWQLAPGLSKGRVSTVLVDPKDRCTVYAIRSNQIQKTSNCGRSWEQAWAHPNSATSLTALAIDWYNPKTLYLGTSDGDILRSDDGALSWRPLNRIDGMRINDLQIDPQDSRVIYAATLGAGIVKSVDGGASWIDMRKQLANFQYARSPKFLVLDPSTRDRVYHVSRYGLLVSDDGAVTWRAVTLPTPSQSAELTTFAVNPKNPKELVYTTKTALVMSRDGGVSWASKKLPTTRGVSWMGYSDESQPSLVLTAQAKPE